MANVFEDRIDFDDVLQMDFDDSDFQKYCLKPGDILLNEGQSTELVGRPAMWRGERDGFCFQNTLVRFQACDRVLPEYALAVFLRYFRTGEFAKISSKT
ncbi:restriction endonuclease subunit S, partial [Streptomyces sp. SID8455]|nr:restriction endonuclease subunit S [Streptomyces sp. SID8455]